MATNADNIMAAAKGWKKQLPVWQFKVEVIGMTVHMEKTHMIINELVMLINQSAYIDLYANSQIILIHLVSWMTFFEIKFIADATNLYTLNRPLHC